MSTKSLNVFAQRLAGCLAAFGAVASVDFVTGYELSMSPLYIFPVALAFFNFGATGGYIAATLSAISWTLIDKWSGHYFHREILRWETGFSRFVFFALSVWGLSIYRKTVTAHQARLEAMRRLIPMCHECGCIRTASGEWKSPEELLAMAPARMLECPACAGSEAGH